MAAVGHLPRIVQEFRGARRRPDLAVLVGFHAVKHALRFGASLEALVGTNAADLGELAAVLAPDLQDRLGAELELVSPEVFSLLAPQAPRTGVMGIARRPQLDVTEMLSDPTPRPIVLLENPRNLQNMGACVRVAAAGDAAGVLTTGTQDPWHADALRGAAGLHFALPVSRIDSVRFGDRPLIAVDPQGDPFNPTRMPPRSVLAFGSERYGISDGLLSRAQRRVALPMRSGISSLNLATSVAAILFAWRLNAV
ncbi:MAG TPA: TrmH family RNA methyltransferase [Solirubrobacteraceae bacterium]|nr:TrmH family RNA methyltransferase [Solirubrobacteraceae bacterium]